MQDTRLPTLRALPRSPRRPRRRSLGSVSLRSPDQVDSAALFESARREDSMAPRAEPPHPRTQALNPTLPHPGRRPASLAASSYASAARPRPGGGPAMASPGHVQDPARTYLTVQRRLAPCWSAYPTPPARPAMPFDSLREPTRPGYREAPWALPCRATSGPICISSRERTASTRFQSVGGRGAGAESRV